MADCCAVKAGLASPPSVLACPVCGHKARQVQSLTVKSLVRHLPFQMTPAQYYFCEATGCDVVYFPSGSEAPLFHRADLLVRVGVKEDRDPIPVCYCFGVTRRDLQDEIRQTGKSSVAERIKAEVKAGSCACEVKNPSGKCCLGTVTRAVQQAFQSIAAPTITKEPTYGQESRRLQPAGVNVLQQGERVSFTKER
ncbi:(2Fe-2S)-binding protein [Acidobacteriia bacterium AH_259_A11_L15]|nr:(2Fe-2S)-binding protein [Acidobacteriia bacterium AH_259_A11_L15]